ncbi:MAG: lipoyl(octanoyl) transferase LipB [Oceanicoccus sp.]|uniref:lipoyl(octanoyl) transferase LipB n=1 Tax=Oceanicoccus sp. TaxID=2691044 RepID=UPI0026275FBF|nr:lipoyl(octanoyl) transferase LipB [Oceanicoccus sp.]MDG1773158.1 lipoyl(octanoyl) transferase LipB [Oceanicoccus sp.]
MLIIRDLGLAAYEPVWQAMQHFTDNRDETTADEIWLLEHPAVFTQGQAGKAEHILAPGSIPVIQVDRGGQVTYHGPGQLVAYLMIDLRRSGMGVRNLVTAIEEAIASVLAGYQIEAAPRADAPGVYVQAGQGAKIAQLGLRVRKGCSFHGLSLNRDMDMEPFQRINPCGYAGMEVTSMHLELAEPPSYEQLSGQLIEQLASDLGYTECRTISDGQPGLTQHL